MQPARSARRICSAAPVALAGDGGRRVQALGHLQRVHHPAGQPVEPGQDVLQLVAREALREQVLLRRRRHVRDHVVVVVAQLLGVEQIVFFRAVRSKLHQQRPRGPPQAASSGHGSALLPGYTAAPASACAGAGARAFTC